MIGSSALEAESPGGSHSIRAKLLPISCTRISLGGLGGSGKRKRDYVLEINSNSLKRELEFFKKFPFWLECEINSSNACVTVQYLRSCATIKFPILRFHFSFSFILKYLSTMHLKGAAHLAKVGQNNKRGPKKGRAENVNGQQAKYQFHSLEMFHSFLWLCFYFSAYESRKKFVCWRDQNATYEETLWIKIYSWSNCVWIKIYLWRSAWFGKRRSHRDLSYRSHKSPHLVSPPSLFWAQT